MRDASKPAKALPEIRRARIADIPAVLVLGWRDFRLAPAFGVLFSLFYVVAGLVIAWRLMAAGQGVWVLPLAAGFAIVAPFTALGLYDVSRRIEAEDVLDWPRVLRVVTEGRGRQLPMLAAVIALIFAAWLTTAHLLFVLFLGQSPFSGAGVPLAALASPEGRAMLIVGTMIGADFAAVLFALTLTSLPMMLEHDVPLGTALGLSLRVVWRNMGVMVLWAAVIALCLGLAMLPAFLGLFVALPVLGHAAWHMYRRLLAAP